MIDYLEQFFTQNQLSQEDNAALSVFRAAPEEEDSAAASAGTRTQEPEPETTTRSSREVEVVRVDAMQRLERALSVEEGTREGVSIRRPDGQKEGEELERRLRRDSRRYDSGFFWY